MTSISLIEYIRKANRPNEPYIIDEDGFLRVDALAKVPVELEFKGLRDFGPAGVDVVFLIDNSGSMFTTSDPAEMRFKVIEEIASGFATSEREELDRVAILLFADNDTDLWMNWSKWSETEVHVHAMPSRGVAGGNTPMAKGMEAANNLLRDRTRAYRMVVLLSDGWPTDYVGEEDDIDDIYIEDAIQYDIIYSTVFLGNESGAGLMMHIANSTDPGPESHPPRFYFHAESAAEIQARYEEAFQQVMNRVVPKNLFIHEKVDGRLSVSDVSLLIEDSDDSECQIHPSTPLEYAKDSFEGADGEFILRFRELVGTVILRFSVSLIPGLVTPLELDGEYIEVPVNNQVVSHIRYDHPTVDGVEEVRTSPQDWPQTFIRFTTGVQVRKELFTEPTKSVKVEMRNLRLYPLAWFWLKEFPSLDLDISNIEDNFRFNPLVLIIRNYMIPRTRLALHPASLVTPLQLIRKIDQYYEANVVRNLGGLIDRRFCMFNYLGKYGYKHIGIFKMAFDIPVLEGRYLSFSVSPAAFGPPGSVNRPVDNPAKKPPHSSRYRHSDLTDIPPWRYVEPNPTLTLYQTEGPYSDLTIETCFSRDIDLFYETLLGIDPVIPLPTPTKLQFWSQEMDSPDITPLGLGDLVEKKSFGLSITVHNRGNLDATADITARSIYIPFSNPNTDVDKWAQPFYGEAQTRVDVRQREPYGAGFRPSSVTTDVKYDTLYKVPRPSFAPPTRETIRVDPKTFSGWIISSVDIEPVEGELVRANNSAVEIVLDKPSQDQLNKWYSR